MELKTKFVANYGKEPLGFLLGPWEALKYRHEVQKEVERIEPDVYDLNSLDINDSKFQGLPVRAKTTPGVDLVCPQDVCLQLCLYSNKSRVEVQEQDVSVQT